MGVVKKSTGALSNVIIADILTTGISTYLAKNLRLGRTGQTFIVDKMSGLLVGASAGGVQNADGSQVLATASASSVIRSGASSALNTWGSWASITKSAVRNQYLTLAVNPHPRPSGEAWQLLR